MTVWVFGHTLRKVFSLFNDWLIFPRTVGDTYSTAAMPCLRVRIFFAHTFVV